MNVAIAENLPCFLFPDEFLSLLPKEYEPVDVETIDEELYRRAVLELRGSMHDDIKSYQAEVIRGGILREIRRYEDGTFSARFDTTVNDACNRKVGDLQFIMHLDWAKHLLHYTITYPEMLPAASYSIQLSTSTRILRVVDSLKDLLSFLNVLEMGKTAFVNSGTCHFRSLRISKCMINDKVAWYIRFYYEHLPFTFRFPYLNSCEARRLLEIYMSKGILGLCHETRLKYWDVDFDDCPEDKNDRQIGVFARLLLQRTLAEFSGDRRTIELLNSVKVFDVPGTPTIWMPRRGRSWDEIVSNVYRIARGDASQRLDAFNNNLSSLDCDRIAAFAALEGCPGAISELGLDRGTKASTRSGSNPV